MSDFNDYCKHGFLLADKCPTCDPTMIVTKQRPAMLCQNCLRLERLVTEARAAIPSSQHSGAIGYAAACDRADRAEHTRDALVAALRECESLLQSRFAIPDTQEGRMAVAMVNKIRTVLL